MYNVPFSSQNPQADLQAQDRCHRIGQTKPVVVYRLVTANTIDQKILERASAKRKLEQMVIHKSEWFLLRGIPTWARLTLLFQLPELDYRWSKCGLLMKISFVSFCLLFSIDKFKGGKAELNQTKSCIDLDELMEMLKARGSER